MTSFLEVSSSKSGLITIHIIIFLILIIFYTSRYFVTIYKKRGLKVSMYHFILKLFVPLLILTSSFYYVIQSNNSEDYNYTWNFDIENKDSLPKNRYATDTKIRGMNVYGIGRKRNTKIEDLVKSNIEWVAVIPYFYQKDEHSKEINTPEKVGVWSRRDSAFISDIQKLHVRGFYTMLKPHLWMSSGWRSSISFEDKNDWNIWFEDYRKNMIHYALLAQKTNVHMFCIGTELNSSLKNNPLKWLDLVREVKSIYTGKLTYAANWDDDLDFTEFWNQMDFIGIQAYYPLTKNANPSLQQIKEGWNKYTSKLKSISEEYDKQILFTEVGYRNDIYATQSPWEWGNFFQRLYRKKSNKTQQLAYRALFESCWNQPWFAGTFPWEWRSSDFPIYKKPAHNTISIWYQK